MPRLRLGFLKHWLLAVLALVALVSTTEVGLSIRALYEPTCESRNGMCPLGLGDSRLLEPSWTTHHRLKPLQTIEAVAPRGDAVALRTNSFGLRGPEPELPKPPGTVRVLCLGDETALAAEVEESETFAARLAPQLATVLGRNIETINGGVPGYCPLLSMLQCRTNLPALEPDVVLLHFDMSDVADDHVVRRHTILRNERPIACPHPVLLSASRPGALRGWDRFHTVRWCRKQLEAWNEEEAPRDDTDDIDTLQGRYAWLRDQPPDWSVYIEHALEPIAQLDEMARHRGCRLVVITTPAPWQVSADASAGRGVRERAGVPPTAHFTSRRPFETLDAWCRSRRIPLIDLSHLLQSDPANAGLYLKHAPRLAPAGHEFVAREVARGLARFLIDASDWRPRELAPEPGSVEPPRMPLRRAVVPRR